mmetsp:Transcript_23354/g.55019  ORF Transcript_23354/g.55019 Transcript_23354/m.55019 type:complete len:361 (+) Transcript_23354:234-1316(+)
MARKLLYGHDSYVHHPSSLSSSSSSSSTPDDSLPFVSLHSGYGCRQNDDEVDACDAEDPLRHPLELKDRNTNTNTNNFGTDDTADAAFSQRTASIKTCDASSPLSPSSRSRSRSRSRSWLWGRLVLVVLAVVYGSLNVSMRMVFARPDPPTPSIASTIQGWFAVLGFCPLLWWEQRRRRGVVVAATHGSNGSGSLSSNGNSSSSSSSNSSSGDGSFSQVDCTSHNHNPKITLSLRSITFWEECSPSPVPASNHTWIFWSHASKSSSWSGSTRTTFSWTSSSWSSSRSRWVLPSIWPMGRIWGACGCPRSIRIARILETSTPPPTTATTATSSTSRCVSRSSLLPSSPSLSVWVCTVYHRR